MPGRTGNQSCPPGDAAEEAGAALEAPKLAPKLKLPMPPEAGADPAAAAAAAEEAAGNRLPVDEVVPKRPVDGVEAPNPVSEKPGWEPGAATGWLPAADAAVAPKRPPAMGFRQRFEG